MGGLFSNRKRPNHSKARKSKKRRSVSLQKVKNRLKKVAKSNKKSLLFSSYVKTEKEARSLESYAKKLGIRCLWQWVKSGKDDVVACDFFKD